MLLYIQHIHTYYTVVGNVTLLHCYIVAGNGHKMEGKILVSLLICMFP